MTLRSRFAGFFAVIAISAVSLFTGAAAPAGASVSLNGSGSSFAGIELNQWTGDVTHPPYNLNINYQSSSSGSGRQDFKDKVVDFAVTDIRYNVYDGTPPDPSTFHYIPVTAGGISFMYNLKAHGFTATSTPIKLSPRTVCGIFTGVVPFWDDPNIQADNPGVKLPHVAITPIMRDDPAGTNYVMEEYCIALEPAEYATWAQYVSQHTGTNFPDSPTSNWPILKPVVAATGSEGAANVVAGANNDGYITAVETGYAAQRNFPVAAVQNNEGQYVLPTDLNVTTALSYATQQPDGTHVLDFNPPSANAYNPSTYSYLLAPVQGIDPNKGKVLVQFTEYCLTIGQQEADQLKYTSIGRSLILYGLLRIKDVPGYVAPTAAELAAIPSKDVVPIHTVTNSGGGSSGGGSSGGGSSGSGSSTGGTGSTGAVSSAGTGTPVVSSSGGSSLDGSSSGSGSSGSSSSGSASLDPSASLTPGVGPLGFTGADDGLLAGGAAIVLLSAEFSRRPRACTGAGSTGEVALQAHRRGDRRVGVPRGHRGDRARGCRLQVAAAG